MLVEKKKWVLFLMAILSVIIVKFDLQADESLSITILSNTERFQIKNNQAKYDV